MSMVTMMMMPRWLLFSLISSALCVCGGLCVPVMSAFFGNDDYINSKLVNYGLSLSAGSMITTALYKMLPYMDQNNRLAVFCGVMAGIFMSLLLNHIVHSFASESLVHCAHSDDEENDNGSENNHGSVHSNHSLSGEQEPLLNNNKALEQTSSQISSTANVPDEQIGACCSADACVPITKSKTFTCEAQLDSNTGQLQGAVSGPLSGVSGGATGYRSIKSTGRGVACLENDIGYDLENLSYYRDHFRLGKRSRSIATFPHSGSSKKSHSSLRSALSRNNTATANEEDPELGAIPEEADTNAERRIHRHHLETPYSKLLSIGLQTCLVITLHKFPEGFIIYYTNKSNNSKSLGLSIFISLTLHNFVEGFAMTLPFYAAFESKFVPIIITTVLGGGSQPLGALIGYLLFRNDDDSNGEPSEEPHMDTLLSVTAGFLVVIGLQMFQTGVGFSDGHHHHEEDEGRKAKENHSLGTTCLKWCCVGVLLIIASGIFT